MNGTEPACRARFGHGGGSRATFGHGEGSRARSGRSETQICPDPARERTRHSNLARLCHRGLGLRANGAAVAAVAPGIDKILVAIHAHNLAMVNAMPAHDLSRAELEIVDVEQEGSLRSTGASAARSAAPKHPMRCPSGSTITFWPSASSNARTTPTFFDTPPWNTTGARSSSPCQRC